MCFATNCFLARREWFVSEPYLSYFRAIDASGGFYKHRWGDACVHMLAVAALLPGDAVLKLESLPYWHQGTVRLPAELASHAQAELRGLTPPPFSTGGTAAPLPPAVSMSSPPEAPRSRTRSFSGRLRNRPPPQHPQSVAEAPVAEGGEAGGDAELEALLR